MNNAIRTGHEVTPLLPAVVADTNYTNGELQHQQSLFSSSDEGSAGRRRWMIWERYMAAVEKFPIRTKCITAAIIFIAADTFAQLVECIIREDRESVCTIDWIRTMRFGALGLFGAPWSHYYFYWLDYFLPPSHEPFTLRTAIKVLIDQFIQAPLLLAIMICALGLMKGRGLHGARQDLFDTFHESLIANWKLWIPASILNIAFVKPSLRVLFVNNVFFFWTIILSIMLNNSG